MIIIFMLLYFFLFCYAVSQTAHFEKGAVKFGVLAVLCMLCLGIGLFLGLVWAGWCAAVLIFALFDLFYDEENFWNQCPYILLFGLLPLPALFLPYVKGEKFSWVSACLFLLEILFYYDVLAYFRRIEIKAGIITVQFLFLSLAGLQFWLFDSMQGAAANGLLLWLAVPVSGLLAFFCLEVGFRQYQSGFERSTKSFQQAVLLQQYEEIRNAYLNMRGWRHDYHNHLQAMKAQLMMGQTAELRQYMKDLEQELEQVDTYVQSGNLMVDAILNSKLSLAEQKGIDINCKAEVPERLPVSDVDLCIILGNLLDNAVEGCEKTGKEQRFLRVYLAVIKKQLYFSVQNSAKEELDFNERNYISAKRGNHGLGMSRVKLLVDKYQGFLNLQNEAGIFACEVTLPLSSHQ